MNNLIRNRSNVDTMAGVPAAETGCFELWDTQGDKRAVIKRADGHGA